MTKSIHTPINKENQMKKSLVVIVLACMMVFAFAATAMADHSPVFYFDFQAGAEVTER